MHGRRKARPWRSSTAREWIGLNPANGQPRGQPIDLGFVPVRPVQYADLDGDGTRSAGTRAGALAPNQQTLAAFSYGHRAAAMGPDNPRSVLSRLPDQPPLTNWPLIVDLDGDGRSEIVVADSGPLVAAGMAIGACGCSTVHRAADRWVRPLQPECRVVALARFEMDWLGHRHPDLDGDGTRDLVAVSRYNGRDPISAIR